MSCKSFHIYARILFLILLPGSLGLRDVTIIIPEAAERGKPVVIQCMYNLEDEDLYQIKWYRGDREFCRYAPREVPPFKIFPIAGIQVHRVGSNATQITITPTTMTAQGRYSCEVSAETPSFLTAKLHGFMYVVDLPKSDPDLIWTKQRYKPGMGITVECISYESMPPANLSFYINNIPALSQHVWQRVSGGENGTLWTAYSTLRFVIQKYHLQRFKIRIRCAATIYSIYYRSHEQVANAERIQTTSAPVTKTQTPTIRPVQRTPENSASWNGKILWAVCLLALLSLHRSL